MRASGNPQQSQMPDSLAPNVKLDPTHAAAVFVNGLSRQDFGAAAVVIKPDGAITPPR